MRNGSNSDKHGGVWNGLGLPSEVRADHETECVSSAFKELLQSLGIQPGTAGPLSDRRPSR
jgi:hypothetical protein